MHSPLFLAGKMLFSPKFLHFPPALILFGILETTKTAYLTWTLNNNNNNNERNAITSDHCAHKVIKQNIYHANTVQNSNGLPDYHKQ